MSAQGVAPTLHGAQGIRNSKPRGALLRVPYCSDGQHCEGKCRGADTQATEHCYVAFSFSNLRMALSATEFRSVYAVCNRSDLYRNPASRCHALFWLSADAATALQKLVLEPACSAPASDSGDATGSELSHTARAASPPAGGTSTAGAQSSCCASSSADSLSAHTAAVAESVAADCDGYEKHGPRLHLRLVLPEAMCSCIDDRASAGLASVTVRCYHPGMRRNFAVSC